MLLRNLLIVTALVTLYANIIIAKEHLTTISAIQGAGGVSPLLDEIVTVEGVVTADFQEDNSFAGFFIQSVGPVIHGEMGSQGIFVHNKQHPVSEGDLVRLTGRVAEQHDLTHIIKVTKLNVQHADQPMPEPKVISLPIDKKTLESLEGMRITLDQAGTITDHYNYIKYGEFSLSSQLLMSPTNVVSPGPMVRKIQQQNAKDRLLIDDGNFDSFAKYFNMNNQTPVYIGAKAQVVGVVHYAFDQYRIQVTEPIEFLTPSTARQSQPMDIEGEVRVAGFNVRNYFTTLDINNNRCGPKKDFSCRGADSAEELMRQQAKLVKVISTANADVYAIQELENNASALQSLVDALNQYSKNSQWGYIKTGVLGEDVIRVGLLYQTKQLTPVGPHKVLNPQVMAEFEADKNRDVLLQTFKDNSGNLFNVAVLHLKSKRCTDAAGHDLDQKDGQGCYNASRAKVAEQISRWLKHDPTGQGGQSTIVLGDFNAYLKEDPIRLFEKNGFSNLINVLGPTQNWTTIFRGNVGSLDHILVNEKAKESAKGLTQWHINSITLGQFDYNLEPLSEDTEKPAHYFQNNPFASSDHDLIIAGFSFSSRN